MTATRITIILTVYVLGLMAAHGAAEETIVLRDHGCARQFTMALDEVALRSGRGRETIRRIPRWTSRARLSSHAAEAARKGEPCDLVLYEAGRKRSAHTRRILTPAIRVRVAPDADLKRICAAAGVKLVSSPSYARDMHVVRSRDAGQTLDVVAALEQMPGVLEAAPLLERLHAKRLIPNDPQFSSQWHLRNTGQSGGTAGMDINVESTWDSFTGSNVLIGIVDDSLKVDHVDLAANVNTQIDWDWNGNDGDPRPDSSFDYHGTPCAGLAAATGRNGVGVCGVAFDATLVGMRLIAGSVSDATEAAAMSHSNSLIHIKSNSWGPSDDGKTLEGPGPLTRAALRDGAENGRGGLGTVYVWAGGNGRADGDMANKDGYANSIYTISVAAVGNQNGWSWYSEPGCSHLVAAPSDGDSLSLVSTDWDGNYTTSFGGTSGATPIVAGVVALMLQANPGLGWRDVQEILIRSATKINPTDTDWADNGAGYPFSHKFGAGLVNAGAAVAMAQTWTNLPPQQSISVPQTSLSVSIPDNDATGVTRTFDLSGESPLRVEQVAVTVDITHASRGQLEVLLTSPAGTVSRLIETHGDTGDNYSNWTFSSVHHWSESSAGIWTVAVKDRATGTIGTLEAVTLTVYGSQAVTPTESPVITSPLTADGTVGESFTYRITASNYPTAFDASPLPGGLSVHKSSGVISGTPTMAGTNTVTISAANALGTNWATLVITIAPAPPKPPVITSSLTADGVADRPFTYQIEATHSPTNYNAIGLPGGLSINTQSGLISGTPTGIGTNPVAITATNADGTGSNTVTIVVYEAFATPFNDALENISHAFTTGGDAGWEVTSTETHDGVDATLSGSINDNQQTYIETSVAGPAALDFWWSVSSEEGFDFLELSIDGDVKRKTSGQKDWYRVFAQIPAGVHVVRWTYNKDAYLSDFEDRGYLDQVTVTPGAFLGLGEALDHTAHTWTDSGDEAWSAQTFETYDLSDAAVSGGVGDDEQTAFQTTVDGPGQVSFYWKVSCEKNQANPDDPYDYLVFTIDGATQALISGEVDWQPRSFSVPAGLTHTLTWTYRKDTYTSEGRDAGWVDRVVYTPDGTAAGYPTWAAQVFTPAQLSDPAISGHGANPDLDPYDNLMEYALDMDALTASASNAPVAQVVGGDFVYRYRHDTGKTNLMYSLERAGMLAQSPWQSATTAVLSTEGSVELREHRHAMTNRTFVRLKVTETGP